MRWPRRDLALCSPSAHRTDSEILLLPHPLGPTMPVIPGRTLTTVFSGNDLKPWSVMASRRMGDFGTDFPQDQIKSTSRGGTYRAQPQMSMLRGSRPRLDGSASAVAVPP